MSVIFCPNFSRGTIQQCYYRLILAEVLCLKCQPMRDILLFLLCCLIPSTAFSQSFWPLPEPVLQQEVALEQANACYIYFDHHNSDSLQLSWKKVEANFPAEWDIDLCDFGTCYVGIPASANMYPAGGDDQPFLELIVQPGTTPGAGWLWFRVWVTGNPGNFQDVYFSLYTPGITSTNSISGPGLLISPNPATSFLNIESTYANITTAQVFDVHGRQMWAGDLPTVQRTTIDCSAWLPGSYFLKTNNKTYTILRVP